MAEFVRVRDFNCKYEVTGNLSSKENILFLNGIASTIESWSYHRKQFETDYKVIGLEYRGQWHSDATPGPYTFKNHAEEVVELLKILEVNKVHIISTSLGGEIAMQLSVDFPEIVQSLTVIASVSEADDILVSQVGRWGAFAKDTIEQHDILPKEQRGDYLKGAAHSFLHNAIPEMYGNKFYNNNFHVIKERDLQFMENITRNFFAGHQLLCEMFAGIADKEKMTPNLHKIKCPSLIIAGGMDILKPPSYSKIIADNIPDSDYVVFPDAGHAVAIERAPRICDLALGHIKRSSK
ncbi:MAG: alpha/beta hydrolase [Gammaproteobacteria bacterium]|nr:MAG: alpha/beta hydrolase [Gammaproteobacteria bacterium]